MKVLGFRAPLGAFVAAWGGIAMLTSAPFDNWWHDAYGLDVKIVSPPHTLLILGIRAVSVGVLFLILAAMNRANAAGVDGERAFHSLQRLFLYMGGLVISGQMFFLMEYTWDVSLHGGYRVCSDVDSNTGCPGDDLTGLATSLGGDDCRFRVHDLHHR